MADRLRFDVTGTESFRAALNAAGPGWLDEEVLAASIMRQGESPSIVGVATGLGLLKLLKRKGMKELPRTFVLAATASRVAAFDAAGTGSDEERTYTVTISPGTLASWAREGVSMRPAKDGMTSNAVLVIEGREAPVAVPNGLAEDAFAELESLLA